VRCLDCNYSLKNLTEHRCPECGRAFDPNDPLTFAPATTKPWPGPIRVLGLGIVAYVLGFMVLYLGRFGLSDWFDKKRVPEDVLASRAAIMAVFILPVSLLVVAIMNDGIKKLLTYFSKPDND